MAFHEHTIFINEVIDKSEIRISKLETNPNVQKSNFLNFFRFEHFKFGHSNLFRNSDFVLRI